MAKWVNTDGWLKGYVDKPSPAAVKEPKKNSDNFSEGVIFIRPRCPICKNKAAKCYKTDGVIRYYKCACGNKFKAYEKEV